MARIAGRVQRQPALALRVQQAALAEDRLQVLGDAAVAVEQGHARQLPGDGFAQGDKVRTAQHRRADVLAAEGIEQGVFRPGKPELIAARLYCVIEAYVLNLTVTDMMTRKECLALIDFSIDDCLARTRTRRGACAQVDAP